MNYSNASNEELKQLVNNKDGEAICELAERCLYGTKGCAVNYTRAYQLLHKGEKLGIPRAYIGLGEMYRTGMYFAKNENIARQYYNKAGARYPDNSNISDSFNIPESTNIPEKPNIPYSPNSNDNNTILSKPKDNYVENDYGGVINKPVYKNTGITYLEIKSKLDTAEKERKNDNYNEAKRLCQEVLRTVENIMSGLSQYSGHEDVEDLTIDANWILAYTAFNQQNYAEMENYLAAEGVQGLHPWGTYLLAVSHRVMQSPPVVMEQDLQSLKMVCGNRNLSRMERGDICAMIGDLISDGYGRNSGITAGMAKTYYEEAMNCGNEYARERYNEG